MGKNAEAAARKARAVKTAKKQARKIKRGSVAPVVIRKMSK